jgi:hypothetical protein
MLGSPFAYSGDVVKTMRKTIQSFDSSHEDESCSPWPHGHTYTVSASSERADIGSTLREIISELHLRNLGKMLNGGSQTIDGLAAWFMERILTIDPTVDSVTVTFMDRLATVTRERR